MNIHPNSYSSWVRQGLQCHRRRGEQVELVSVKSEERVMRVVVVRLPAKTKQIERR
jgi:hypothetical protein